MKTRGTCRTCTTGRLRLVEPICHSELFRVYQQAFEEASGLSLRLASADGTLMPDGGMPTNAFCGQLPPGLPLCAACSSGWREAAKGGDMKIRHHTCFAGLCESRVPIRVGARVFGFLVVARAATVRPTRAKFQAISARLKRAGVPVDQARLERAYLSTPATNVKHHASFLGLLEVFAGHLSLIANLLVLEENGTDDPQIRRARAFIHEHLSEPLPLGTVARRASLSSCHFSTKFKESTGLTFTEYVATARVEAAKKLLTNSGSRVSDVAFEVGFQSLTHFNRVFRGLTGVSPTRYRGTRSKSALNPDGLGCDQIDTVRVAEPSTGRRIIRPINRKIR